LSPSGKPEGESAAPVATSTEQRGVGMRPQESHRTTLHRGIGIHPKESHHNATLHHAKLFYTALYFTILYTSLKLFGVAAGVIRLFIHVFFIQNVKTPHTCKLRL
jgi:hypothetical protein